MEGKQTLEDGSTYEGELSKGNQMVMERERFPPATLRVSSKTVLLTVTDRLYQSDEEIDRYSGLWASGKKEGFGTLIYSDSSRMEGHWESGELLYGEYQGRTV